MIDETFERGMEIRRSVLGEEHVERAERAKTAFDADFQAFITRTAWGEVWSRPGLTRRERSLITLAVLTALGRDAELELHLGAIQNTGTSVEDVKEVLLHTAIYAGLPAANHAVKIAKALLSTPEPEGREEQR